MQARECAVGGDLCITRRAAAPPERALIRIVPRLRVRCVSQMVPASSGAESPRGCVLAIVKLPMAQEREDTISSGYLERRQRRKGNRVLGSGGRERRDEVADWIILVVLI